MIKYDDEATLELLDAMERLKRLTEHGKKFSHSPEEIYNAVSVLHSISSALEDGANPNPIENVSLVGELCRCPLDGRAEPSQTIKLAVAFGADLSIPDLTVQANELPAVVRSPIASMLEIGLSEEELRRRLDAVLTDIKPNTLLKLMRPVPVHGTQAVSSFLCCTTASHTRTKRAVGDRKRSSTPSWTPLCGCSLPPSCLASSMLPFRST